MTGMLYRLAAGLLCLSAITARGQSPQHNAVDETGTLHYQEANMHLCPEGKWALGEDRWGKIVRVNMLKITAADCPCSTCTAPGVSPCCTPLRTGRGASTPTPARQSERPGTVAAISSSATSSTRKPRRWSLRYERPADSPSARSLACSTYQMHPPELRPRGTRGGYPVSPARPCPGSPTGSPPRR